MNINIKKSTITLIVLMIACILTITSQSIITTSISNIISDFNTTASLAQWTYTGFLLVLGVMVPPTAYITRKFKIKTILTASLGTFLIGSFICTIAPNIYILIIGRLLQAICVGILMPVTLIVIYKILPEDKWAKTLGIYGIIMGVFPAFGPTIGGIITDLFNWRMVFLFFTIGSLLILLLTILLIKFDMPVEDCPLDIYSLILSIIGCTAILLAFSNISSYGLISLYVIIPLIIGLITLYLFIKRQGKLEYPLLRLEILKDKHFKIGTLFVSLLYFSMCGINMIVPLFVQQICNYSATYSGLVLLPGAVLLVIFNGLGTILADKIGIKKVLLISSIFTIIGFLSMMTYNINSSIEYMIITQAIRCIGAGLGLMPSTNWAVTSIIDYVDDATAINNTVRQIIGALGTSIMVLIMTVFANGYITNNSQSVVGFQMTSALLLILGIINLVITIFYVKEHEVLS